VFFDVNLDNKPDDKSKRLAFGRKYWETAVRCRKSALKFRSVKILME